MSRLLTVGLIVVLLAAVAGLAFVVGVFFLSVRTALDTPSDALRFIAESGKNNYLIPGSAQSLANPQASLDADAVATARRVFTARCVTCHGADGKGQTPIGLHTLPRAADLTDARTQTRSDGALFWLTANGIPHTGMPGWKGTLSDDEIWQLISYLRLLPKGQDAIAKLLPTPTATPTVPPTPTPAPQATAAPIRPSNTVTVTIDNYNYLPPTLNATVGTRVVWVNQDDDIHNAVSEDKPQLFGSPVFDRGGSYSFVFTQPGTYRYFCEPHDFMHGVIVVK